MKKTKVRLSKPKQELENMELIRVRQKYQLTLPQSLRDKLKLAVGDYVEADIEDGKLVIRPVQVVRSDEADKRPLSKERQAAYAALDEIWAKTRDEDPKEAERIVAEAVRDVRRS